MTYDEMTDHELLDELARQLRPAEADPSHFAFTPWMWAMLGFFHASWSTADSLTDYAIGHLLQVSNEEAHLITSGMMFGRKARLLSDLIRRSDHPKKADLKRTLSLIRGTARRDMIAHSYILAEDDGRVAFLERSIGGEFSAKKHRFTRQEFAKHVQTLWNAAHDFAQALGVSDAELDAFTSAALSASKSAKTSPVRPLRRASS